jgi:CheY-like chemotaxis protein
LTGRAAPDPTDRENEVLFNMPTALIVEDEPEANKLLAMLVQLRGYRTDSAFTGSEALEKIGRTPPDIVFLDLMLPDINGYEVCKSLKNRKTTSAIPVVMVTARVAAENRLECFFVGADDYIPKPYTPDQIFQAMAVADAWRRHLERQDFDGEIPIETRDECESLRQVSLLRNLLLTRTPLDPDAVRRIASALQEIWRDAVDWGQAQRVNHVATLTYRLQPDALTLELTASSPWLDHGPSRPEQRWPKSLAAAEFDEISPAGTEPSRRISFVRRFPSGDPSARS